MHVPNGFHEVCGRGAFAFALPAARSWVEATLASGAALYEAASRHPGAIRLEGRGPVYVIETPTGKWVVRRYRRGGGMRILGDRFLRGTEARPLRETRVSLATIERGVSTPPVVAGAIYPQGPFYRADLVTEYAAGTADLGAILFTGNTPPERRTKALEAAGGLVVDMARAGIEHPDLNAKNILIDLDDVDRGAMVVDLDRTHLEKRIRPLDPARMVSRLERSLWKLGAKTSRPLPANEWIVLRQAAASRTANLDSRALPLRSPG
jgi:3-deoxy-D-manno-octulosonic acid kinase